MSDTHKQIIEKVNAAFAKNNLEGFLSCCADDVEFTMVGEKTVKGKDAIRDWMGSMMDSEPPQIQASHIVSEGDVAISDGDMTMKDKDGKTVPYAYCDIYRFQGDKIAALRAFLVKTEPKYQASGA